MLRVVIDSKRHRGIFGDCIEGYCSIVCKGCDATNDITCPLGAYESKENPAHGDGDRAMIAWSKRVEKCEAAEWWVADGSKRQRGTTQGVLDKFDCDGIVRVME